MNLLDRKSDKCAILEPATQSDGLGGVRTVYTQGETFRAAIALTASNGQNVAQSEKPNDTYSIYTERRLFLAYHTVFKRLSDGAIFRVTNDGQDNTTPAGAGLDLRCVTAERFEGGTET